jgi:glycosyltransferase involved in cell wall biosynthesis
MKVCMIGKYPPIQGGVSMQNYWIAHGLAERGHQIYLVTNADEVEPEYRMYVEEDDKQWFEPRFEEVGGFVNLRNSERFNARRMSHIPQSNPYVTKLASIATDIVRQYDCELIYSYYFEPYGMAGYLASIWTGKPLVIQHAGSDLDRLMNAGDLATAYKQMLSAADFLVTKRPLVSRFIAIGVDENKISSDMPFGIPTKLFNPDAPTMDVVVLLQTAAAHINDVLKWHANPIDMSKPTIGIYGKVGLFKGSYDLVAALSKLKKEGLDFNFLAMTQGSQIEQFRNAVKENQLEQKTWILPFLPHWRVPGFIRACTAVCFLERDFPITIHGPTVPREVIACGKCLLLSGEIVKKQFYRDELIHEENLLVVNDPKDRDELSGLLRHVIEEPEAAARIGAEGHKVSTRIERFAEFINGYERLFSACCAPGQDTARRIQSDIESRLDSPSADSITTFLPYTSKLLSDRLVRLVSQFDSQNHEGASRILQVSRFCAYVSELLDSGELDPKYAYFADLFSFESTEVSMLAGSGAAQLPSFSDVDRLNGQGLKGAALANLKPLKTNYYQVKTFGYDIQRLIDLLDEEVDLPASVEQRPTSILFVRLPNMRVLKMRINKATRELLEFCNGRNTAEAITDSLYRSRGVSEAKDTDKLGESVAAALKRLYENGVIIFC